MVVSQKVFLRVEKLPRRRREPAGFALVFDRVTGIVRLLFVLSNLVLKFYETDMGSVIISCCEFLSPVVLLAKRDNYVLKRAGNCGRL